MSHNVNAVTIIYYFEGNFNETNNYLKYIYHIICNCHHASYTSKI